MTITMLWSLSLCDSRQSFHKDVYPGKFFGAEYFYGRDLEKFSGSRPITDRNRNFLLGLYRSRPKKIWPDFDLLVPVLSHFDEVKYHF